MSNLTPTSTCRFCMQPIYSAGGPRNKGKLGWLHSESGSAKCATDPPRAEPAIDGVRPNPKKSTKKTKQKMPDQSAFAELLQQRFAWLGTDDDAGSGADVISELGALYEDLMGGQVAAHSTMAAANRGFLAGTADKIDRTLHLQEHCQITTGQLLDEFACLRDTIREHLTKTPNGQAT